MNGICILIYGSSPVFYENTTRRLLKVIGRDQLIAPFVYKGFAANKIRNSIRFSLLIPCIFVYIPCFNTAFKPVINSKNQQKILFNQWKVFKNVILKIDKGTSIGPSFFNKVSHLSFMFLQLIEKRNVNSAHYLSSKNVGKGFCSFPPLPNNKGMGRFEKIVL